MSASPNPHSPNPRRVAAGRLNRLKRGPLTPDGRKRLRVAALADKPWLAATGPRSPEGKARSARNGKLRQKGDLSVRDLRRSVADVTDIIAEMLRARKLLAE